VKYGGILPWIPLFIIIRRLLRIFKALLRNPKLIISGDKINISTFGNWHTISFSKDLYEVIVEADEVITYKFETDDFFYNISPSFYYDSEEISKVLSVMLDNTEMNYNIVTRKIHKEIDQQQ
jgi:hypothetical protein